MVDVLSVTLKFRAILESRFSKCGSFFEIFFDFIVICGFLIELKQNHDWQLLLLEQQSAKTALVLPPFDFQNGGRQIKIQHVIVDAVAPLSFL